MQEAMRVEDGSVRFPDIAAQTTSADTYRHPGLQLSRSKTTLIEPPANYQTTIGKSYAPPVLTRGGTTIGAMRSETLNAPFRKYTPDDWHRRNQDHFLTSNTQRSTSERLRADTYRLVQEKDQLTNKNQAQSSKDIGNRVADIDFWKSELRHETDLLVGETNALTESKKRLERALVESESPLGIAKECLYNRDKREGIDLVHDNVEAQLNQEVDVILSCQEKMKRLIQRAEQQLQNNRGAQHELDKDSHDKMGAFTIDNRCHGLQNTSAGINYYAGIEHVDNTVTIPTSWAKFSDANIRRSQAERAASAKMREEIEACLNKTSNDMWTQWNRVNVAFTQRVAEQVDAKNKLQSHLNRTLQEIHDVESTITRLQRAIEEKERPTKVAETRLDERTRRPNLELCRDPAQLQLVHEVKNLQMTLAHLRSRLQEEQEALQRLVTTRANLEHEIRTKANSIFIDQEKCMGMRKTFPTTPRLSGYAY